MRIMTDIERSKQLKIKANTGKEGIGKKLTSEKENPLNTNTPFWKYI